MTALTQTAFGRLLEFLDRLEDAKIAYRTHRIVLTSVIRCPLTVSPSTPALIQVNVRVRDTVAPGATIANVAEGNGIRSDSVFLRLDAFFFLTPLPPLQRCWRGGVEAFWCRKRVMLTLYRPYQASGCPDSPFSPQPPACGGRRSGNTSRQYADAPTPRMRGAKFSTLLNPVLNVPNPPHAGGEGGGGRKGQGE